MNAEMFLYGLLGSHPWWMYVLIAVTSNQILANMGVTIYLHRAMAHSAVRLHPWVAHFFRLGLWLVTGMSTKEWVAVHRKHHAFSDKPGDPHSPVVFGFWRVFPLGVVLYIEAVRYMKTAICEFQGKTITELERYGAGTPDDWMERNIYRRYPFFGNILGALFLLVLFGIFPGGLMILAHALWIPFHGAAVINGLGHSIGYRNYATSDNSRNTLPFFSFAFWIGGEELHNNHHAFAVSPKFSHRWFEFDIGWGVITLLQLVGLAEVDRNRLPPKISFSETAVPIESIDARTLHAICTVRERIVRWFEQAERREKRQPLQGALNELVRARESLSRLWTDTSGREEELIARLRNWSQQARSHRATAVRTLANHIGCLQVIRA